MCSREVHCSSVPQTVCRSPSGSSWSLLSGTVMSFWWSGPMWKASSTGSRPRLKLWRSHSDQPVSSSRTSRMWSLFICIRMCELLHRLLAMNYEAISKVLLWLTWKPVLQTGNLEYNKQGRQRVSNVKMMLRCTMGNVGPSVFAARSVVVRILDQIFELCFLLFP